MSSAGMSSKRMSSGPGAQPALSLTSRLTSNLARGPLFFFFTGVFGCMSLAASFLEKDGSCSTTSPANGRGLRCGSQALL